MRSVITTLACALFVAPGFAQETPDTDKRLADLERRLEAMSRELETQKTGSALPSAANEGQFGLGAGASKVYNVPSGLSIGGYGEFLYENKAAILQDGTRVGNEKVVDALRMVLYTGYKFTDRIVFNSEFEWEHGGYSDEHPEGEAIVEFAYLDFLFTKALNVRAGMLLVPMGFTNEMHEPPSFLGARRPMVENEGGIIPTTWNENGVGLHGDLPGNLSYRLYLMNGLDGSRFAAKGISDGRQMGKEAKAQSLAWSGRLDWTPKPGVLLGTSFYTGNSNQSGIGEDLTTTVWETHAEYRAAGFQFRGLYARTSNSDGLLKTLGASDPAREVGTRQWGGYLEAGYDLLAGGRTSLIPFARWERLNTQQGVIPGVVPFGANDQSVMTLGLNYRPIPNVAIKGDVQSFKDRARTGRDQVNLALGFFF